MVNARLAAGSNSSLIAVSYNTFIGSGVVQRKVFRIEEMASARRRPLSSPPSPAAAPAPARQGDEIFESIELQLAAMRAAIAKSKAELASLSENSDEKPIERAQKELHAAISGMEDATGDILKSSEGAEEAARNLFATLRDDYKRGLAHDIIDHVVKIYEHCHFQDLAGQRINKAIGTLRNIDDKLARLVEVWGGLDQLTRASRPTRPGLLNGPKLEGDRGHASQADIDRMFA
jgi:chemotaxis protein CheZ